MLRRADLAFVFGHPAHFIAFGFGSGLAPIAPGTWGSLVGIPLTLWLLPAYGDVGFGLIIVGAFVLGVWVCDITGRRLGIADYGGIVWDEVVAMMLVLWLLPALTWGWILAAFVLFRIFDAAKPGPVAWADALFKVRRGHAIGWAQGFGILFDDLVAALCTLFVIALWRFV